MQKDQSPSTVLPCPQCGGELHPDEGQVFLICPYCASSVYIDKSQVLFHWYLADTLDENRARAALARWMAGNQTVKDLDRKAAITSATFAYFPMWAIRLREGKAERSLLEPAAATSVTELKRLGLPAGDLRKYEEDLDPMAVAPTVPLATVLAWLAERGVTEDQTLEKALVHLPLYTFKYTYTGRSYTAVVEGATGGVYANLYPAKAEAPYVLAAGVTAATYLCLATLPLIGFTSGFQGVRAEQGAAFGLLLCSGIGLLVAPFLFAFAAWVTGKV